VLVSLTQWSDSANALIACDTKEEGDTVQDGDVPGEGPTEEGRGSDIIRRIVAFRLREAVLAIFLSCTAWFSGGKAGLS
jgi:hypothetical protein